MKVGRVALAGLVAGAGATYDKAEKGDAYTQGPMAKVVMLLESMTAEIKSEMAAQAAISKKLQCWAETNRREKAAAIAANTGLVTQKESEIKKNTALNASQDIKIKNLNEDIADDENGLAEAEEMRKKEVAKFGQYENDTRKYIQQMGGALVVLKKFNSFAQLSAGERANLQTLLHKIGEKFALALDSGDISKAKSFLQSEHQPYATQSGEIFGILSQMKETMEADLAAETKTETEDVEQFNKMRAAKRAEIKSQKEELFKTKEESARTKEALAIAKKTVKEATETIAADKEFVADVSERSAADAKELDTRVKAQTEELTAIAECKKILMADESRTHLQKTIKKTFTQTNFLQTGKRSMKSRRERAAALLRRSKNPQLQLLATQVGLNAFTKVKKAINDLIAELKQKKEDQYKKRDYCVAAFDENAASTDETNFNLEDLEGTIADLQAQIEALVNKIDGTNKAVEELTVDTAVATNERKEENAEYQQVYNDQKVTVEILAKAKQKLTDFYNAKKKAFLSESQPGGPVGLKEGGYKKRNGGGVIQMLDMIIGDAQETLQLAVSDEQAAQTAYEKFLDAAHRDMGTLQATLVTDHKTKASKEQDLVDTKTDHASALSKLESLTKAKAALKGECDFTIKNFDDTQAAMAQEIEALIGAVSILSGAMS